MNIDQLKYNINVERKKRNKSIQDICNTLGKSRYWISKLSNPRMNTIIDIAYAIGCKPFELWQD